MLGSATGVADEQDSEQPVKVYILSGQSNMVGIGQVTGGTVRWGDEFTDPVVSVYAGDFDPNGGLPKRGRIRRDLHVHQVDRRSGGPEFGFGHLIGDHHDEPVLILKASQGNRSPSWDFLPPGSRAVRVRRNDLRRLQGFAVALGTTLGA